MRDVVQRIRKHFGPVPRELAYEAANEILLQQDEIERLTKELGFLKYRIEVLHNTVELLAAERKEARDGCL